MPAKPAAMTRRSIRLPGFDYAQAGAYFVTIVTYQRSSLFDAADLRQAAEMAWQSIPLHASRARLDAWILMPNHLHGILVITNVHTGLEAPAGDGAPLLVPHSLGAIVGSFKSVSARRINQLRQMPGEPVWQRNYYEHVIRDDDEMQRIRLYIAENPAQWALDSENPLAV